MKKHLLGISPSPSAPKSPTKASTRFNKKFTTSTNQNPFVHQVSTLCYKLRYLTLRGCHLITDIR